MRIHTHTYTQIRIHIHIPIYIRIHTHVYIHRNSDMYTHLRAHICEFTHVCTRIHMHTALMSTRACSSKNRRLCIRLAVNNAKRVASIYACLSRLISYSNGAVFTYLSYPKLQIAALPLSANVWRKHPANYLRRRRRIPFVRPKYHGALQ